MPLPLLVFASVLTLAPPADTEYRQPQLATEGHRVGLTFGAKNSIYYAESADNGAHFSEPVKVTDADQLALGRHRGPRLVILPDALVISAVIGGSQSGNLVALRSTDRGRTWTRTATINDAPHSAREGLHAMAADSKGNLFAAWLDDRDQGKRLYGARSTDGGRTWSKNVLIYASPDGTICQCCHPSLAFDAQGQVWVMWRNALGGSRDLYVAHSRDGAAFTGVQKLGDGTWPLQACPMDGGALAFDRDAQPVTAWRRGEEVFLDRPGQPEKLLGKGKDVAMTTAPDGVYAVWTGPQGLTALTPKSSSVEILAPKGAFPQLTRLPNGKVLAAWEDGGQLRFQVL